jgi:invasion protein IalB
VNRPRYWCAAILLGITSLAVWAADSETFGNWTAKCEASKDGKEGGCFIYQNLVLREGGQRVLQVAIGYVPNSNEPIALLSLPLGISLPPGVSIELKQDKPLRFQVERCEPNGCRAGVKLKKRFVDELVTGQELTVRFHDAQRQPIEVPVSLKGLGDGLKSLTQKVADGANSSP